MSLFTSAALVSLGIAISVLIPHYWPGVRAHSRTLMFIGTVVLLAFVALDLVPEMLEIGGLTAVALMVVSWIGFSALHSMQPSHHGHDHDPRVSHLDEKKEHSITALVGSMALHCFSGGMMLVSAYEVSAHMAMAVFFSLVGHKAFEAISLSSLMIDRVESKKALYGYALVYALSFPMGVGATLAAEIALKDRLTEAGVEYAAMILTSVAIGSLFGCLLQDFLIPSLRDLKRAALLRKGVAR